MAIEISPLPLPASADRAKFETFGRVVKGVNPGRLTAEDFEEIEQLLYKHDLLLFRDVELSPEQQYALNKAFDPTSETYGHGNDKTGKNKASILQQYLKTIPRVPQVQLIGSGTIYNHEGLPEAELKHLSHHAFHKSPVSQEDEDKGITRFYRWHMDAALYDLSPPKVTTLYALDIPDGPSQVCRYDDGTGDELQVPLGTTAFVSGRTAFDILPKELKSLAVRSKVKYSPHPFTWMKPAKAMSTGLGIESDGLELPMNELPEWEESKIKTLPMCWANAVTKDLHFEVHPCGALEILVEPLPDEVPRDESLFPDGAHIKDLKAVRELLYEMQRPAISPSLVYPHDWSPKDLVVFHNRGVLHTAVGAFKPDQIRVLHQCNLAASSDPTGPTSKQVEEYA